MHWSGWINFGITLGLFIAFVVAVIYYYTPKRKSKVESPKYRMLEDDEQSPSEKADKKGAGRDKK